MKRKANSSTSTWDEDIYDDSLRALGIVIEVDGQAVEYASWLRSEDSSSHSNMAELDAVIKGVNAALAWKLKHCTCEQILSRYITGY